MLSAALRRISREESGQALVEYLLVIVLIAIGLLSLVNLLSETLFGFLTRVVTALQTIVP